MLSQMHPRVTKGDRAVSVARRPAPKVRMQTSPPPILTRLLQLPHGSSAGHMRAAAQRGPGPPACGACRRELQALSNFPTAQVQNTRVQQYRGPGPPTCGACRRRHAPGDAEREEHGRAPDDAGSLPALEGGGACEGPPSPVPLLNTLAMQQYDAQLAHCAVRGI